MARMRASEGLIRSLETHGVEVIFGIISSHTMEIFDALHDHTDRIRFVSARHEHAAAMMADGYARATGRPGVCLTSSGPGAANAMGGLGEAYFASSPVLHITSTAEETLYERKLGTIHETKDQLAMLDTVSQESYHVSKPETIPARVAEAFERFQTRRPRPFSIEIPVDVQGQEVEIEIPSPARAEALAGDARHLAAAASALTAGGRAGVLAGTGVHRSGAHEELRQLVERLSLPVFTTANGKGAIDEDHPLCLGMYGGEYNFPPGGLPDPRQAFIESLDLLLVVGSSLSYFRAKSQGLEQPQQLIHVDIDRDAMDRWYEASVPLVGDARVVLGQLNAALGRAGAMEQTQFGLALEVAEARDRIAAYKCETMPGETRTMEAIRSVVDRDAIFVGDVSICNHRGTNYCLESYGGRNYMTPAWGGLGFALPAAVGAKAGLPDRQVIAIAGDGGFQFNIQELGSCAQYGISPVFVVFNDSAWGLLRQFQRERGGRYIASELVNPDFVGVAESSGILGVRVDSVDGLVGALGEALRSEVATLIEVETPEGFAAFGC